MMENANISSDNLDPSGKDNIESSSHGNCTISLPVGINHVFIVIHIVALLVALVGNTLLIVAFVRMKEIIMLPIANMAASDLLGAIFLLPRLITFEVTDSKAFLVHGSGGTFLCKMCIFLTDASLSVSTQSLVLLAIERFLAIVYPILYKSLFTVKRRYFLAASTWIVAMVMYSPFFYTFRLINKNNGTDLYCEARWEPAFDASTQPRYELFLFIAVVLLPLLIIFALYSIVYIHIRRDKIASARTERGAMRHQERSKNLQRLATVTVTSFLVCWTPYIVINIFRVWFPAKVPKCSESFTTVYHIIRVLASCYCAINPCICFTFVPSFSRKLSAMCRRKGQRSVKKDGGQNRSSKDRGGRIELQGSSSESAQTSITRNGNNHSTAISGE